MGNKQKSVKNPDNMRNDRAFYIDNKTIENDDQSDLGIKKSPIASEMSEDYIKSVESSKNLYKDSKFSLNKSQAISNAIFLHTNNENQELTLEMLDYIVYDENPIIFRNVFPDNEKALKKLKNSNFWYDTLNNKFAEDVSPNDYSLSLTKLHVICEIFDFQKELRIETFETYKNLFFFPNQSGNTPFHLIFKKLISKSQILTLLPSVIDLAITKKQLLGRNKRGENFLHCLLQNSNLGIRNKLIIVKNIKKIISEEDYEELILQENLVQELPYIHASILKTNNNEDEEKAKWNLLGNLIPVESFWMKCERMREYFLLKNEEIFEFFVFNTKPTKTFQEYYEFLYIYNINIAKALLINREYGLLIRYYEEKVLNFNFFSTYYFPCNFQSKNNSKTHFLEMLLDIDLKENTEYNIMIENLTKELEKILTGLFKNISKKNDFDLTLRFKKFLYEFFDKTFSNQILSKIQLINNKNPKQKYGIIIKPINLFKRILYLLYSTLTVSNKEIETRIMIKDIHHNLFSAIYKKYLNIVQTMAINEGIISLVNQLQKIFPERDIGIIIVDLIDYSLKNYKYQESFFKKLLKNYLGFLINSLDLSYYIDLIDDILCFIHVNRKKNFLKKIKATPLFILRLIMDQQSLNRSSLNLDSKFSLINVYECVKLNQPTFLNILRQLETFNESGYIAHKILLSEPLTNKEPHVIRNAGIHFYTSKEGYRLCLKTSKYNLFEMAYKKRNYWILLILLEWEASNTKELSLERLKIIKLFLTYGKFKYLGKDILSKISLKFKDVWLEGTYADMKLLWDQIFNLNAKDFKFKFLKSNIKEILDSKIRDDNLFELCRNLQIEVNDIKDDFMMISEKINGFEMLVDKQMWKSLRFFLDHYLINIRQDLKSEAFMNIFNKKMKFNGGFTLFETLILNNDFKFFFDNRKRILSEKLDINKLTIFDTDGSYNIMISNQINKFFLFCLIFDIGDFNSMKNLYFSLLKMPTKQNFLTVILTLLLINARWGILIDRDELKKIYAIIENSKSFNQNLIENILKQKRIVHPILNAMKYNSNDQIVFFEKSLCSFRYLLMKFMDYIDDNFTVESKLDDYFSLKNIMDKSKFLNLEKDNIILNSSWVIFNNTKEMSLLNTFEKIISLIDFNYLENSYSYFSQNISSDYQGCYFKLNILENKQSNSKELMVLDNEEGIDEPLILIKCEYKPLNHNFKNFFIIHPYISEYKLW